MVEGHEVPGYRDEERVAPQSTVETFVAPGLLELLLGQVTARSS